MRYFSILLILNFFIQNLFINFAYSGIKGMVDNSLLIDYSDFDKEQLSVTALESFLKINSLDSLDLTQEVTDALLIHNLLNKIDPGNYDYYLKLGVLYDKLNKDKLAKESFVKAISIDSTHPESYYYLGNFYYKRNLYRKALKVYKKAYSLGYRENNILLKICDIYQKFGDTKSALKYLDEMDLEFINVSIEQKRDLLLLQNKINKEYYSNYKIRD